LPQASSIANLIAQSRRRAIGNLVADQLTVGAAAAFAGLILLLLVGSQVLEWYWIAALFLSGSAISAWRTLR
jgi:hypothetical protein